jgi:hypothetical protein
MVKLFAASNTIVIKGNNTWIVSGGMKGVFYSADKGILGKYTIRQLYKGKR